MTRAGVLWTRDLPGTFHGSGVTVVPDGLVLKVFLNGAGGVVGLDRNGDQRWQLAPTSLFWADRELLWFGGRRLRLVRASDGVVLAERDLTAGVAVLAPGVAMVGGVGQGKLMGFDANLNLLWEFAERPGSWSITPNYLCGVHEAHSDMVALPQLERRKIPVAIPDSGVHLAFEHESVVAYVAIDDGESCGVSWEHGKEVWRRAIEPRSSLAVKWGDSFIVCSERLERIEISTGKTVWARPLESWASHPRVVDDEIYFSTKSARIQVVNCRTGEMAFDAPPFFETERSGWPYAVLPCGPDKLFVVMNTELHCVSR